MKSFGDNKDSVEDDVSNKILRRSKVNKKTLNKKSSKMYNNFFKKVLSKFSFRRLSKKKPSRKSLLVILIEFLIFILLLMLFFHLIIRYSKVYSINALAVSGADTEFPRGSTAKIYLWLRDGTGNVFVDTSPMSSVDLQASIRYSNHLACEFLGEDCSKYDFFYRVDASSFLVSGPSASMAIAVLTVAALNDLDISDDVAVTGTINSGYLIGPVAGLFEKVQSTFGTNITTILIPFGQSILEHNNQTVDLVKYGNELGNKQVIEITNLYDALEYFTGKRFNEENVVNASDYQYELVMKEVSQRLCDRTKNLLKQVNSSQVVDENNGYFELALDFYNDSLIAKEKGNYYAAASFCFSANPRLSYLLFKGKNPEDIEAIKEFVEDKIMFFEQTLLKQEAQTLGDLQIKGVVNARIQEAKKELNNFESNESNLFSFAYAFERVYSAVLWSKFYSLDKRKLDFDENYLKRQCLDRIHELNSMKELLMFYLPQSTMLSIDLKTPKQYFEEGKYDLCLFEALKTRATINVYNTYLFVNNERFNETISKKLDAALTELRKQTAKGYFPIVAYSYYTYAKQLAEQGHFSLAILFSEYAIELSKMDLFINEQKTLHLNVYIIALLLGISLGIFIRDVVYLLR